MKFKSQVYTAVSGSIGGITYSHNAGGMYTRARAIPTNPNTPRQMSARAAMNAVVQAWNSVLTAAQRTGWANYAQNTPVTNPLGDQIILSGQQQYLRSNAYRVRAGLSPVNDAPTIFNTGEPITAMGAPTFVDPTLTVQCLFGTPTSDDGNILFQLGFSLNAGQTFYAGPYQFGNATAVAAAASFQAATVANTDVTVPIVIGNRITMRARVAYDDGRLSEPFRDVQTVV